MEFLKKLFDGNERDVAKYRKRADQISSKPGQLETVQIRRVVRLQPLILPPLVIPSTARPMAQAPAFFVAPPPALGSFNPFPHATRAP